MKVKNQWYRDFYDDLLADITIDSPKYHLIARKDVNFLVRTLKPPKQTKFLDIPCGTGRHSVLLAKKGFDVVGIDISPPCLNAARKKAKNLENVHFLHGNILNLEKFKNHFPFLINMYTSFGYFKDDKTNEKAMKELVNCLSPKGKICFQLVNRSWLIHKAFKERFWNELPDFYLLAHNVYDRKIKYISSRWIVISKTGKISRKYFHKIRIYDKAEFVNLMKKYGLKNIEVYGGSDGSRFHPLQSSHPIYFGEKD